MNKFVIGLTGGIGSGKTAAAERFAAHGIDVVDADRMARVVVEPGQPALGAIAERYGPGMLNAEGALDRAQLRARVFADEAERRWLEDLLHPRIAIEIFRGLNESTSPYVLLVSPLLFESKQSTLSNRVLVIDVPEELQMQRTMQRDANSAEQVRAIMAAQLDREARRAKADDIIVNSGTLDQLHREVDKLHQQYLELAAQFLAARKDA